MSDDEICWCQKPRSKHCRAVRRVVVGLQAPAVDMACHNVGVVRDADGRLYCRDCARELGIRHHPTPETP